MLAGYHIIKKAIDDGDWTAHRDGKPITTNDLKIGPHSIDVSLGGTFIKPKAMFKLGTALRYQTQVLLDPYDKDTEKVFWENIEADHYDLLPGEFLLGHVRERFDSTKAVPFSPEEFVPTGPLVCGGPTPGYTKRDLKYVTQCYDGRSTMGRLGIMSHVTAGYGDYGFASNFTLELHNVNEQIAIRLHKGMRIGQISFHVVGGDPKEYTGSYSKQHDKPVAPSLGWKKFVQPGELPPKPYLA